MHARKPNPFLIITCVGTLAYPLLVYHYLSVFPPLLFAALALFLISVRLLGMRRLPERGIWIRASVFAGLLLILVALLSETLAVKAYPVIVSLTMAGIFGFSLLYPPTLVERMARITRPNLSAQGIAYTRKVTIMWLVFLLANAAISAATALWGSLAQWTLWNGLVSYLLMGMLFAAEYIVRRRVQR